MFLNIQTGWLGDIDLESGSMVLVKVSDSVLPYVKYIQQHLAVIY